MAGDGEADPAVLASRAPGPGRRRRPPRRRTFTDDRDAAARAAAEQVPGLWVDDALASPFLAIGTIGEVADHLRRVRDRWGITYVTVRSIDAFAPVIAKLRNSP